MVAALGVNQARLFTGVFTLGVFLAALGGAVQIPREAVHHAMDMQVIVEAFVIVVIGGLGSVPGAFLAAVLVGLLNAFGILLFPKHRNCFDVPGHGRGAGGTALHGLLGRPEDGPRAGIGRPRCPWRPPGTARPRRPRWPAGGAGGAAPDRRPLSAFRRHRNPDFRPVRGQSCT